MRSRVREGTGFFVNQRFVVLYMQQANNPLHGKTLEMVLNELVAHYGWPEMGYRIRVNCFLSDPSVKSSLKFLRKTQWAREKVEQLYVETFFKS